MFILGVRNNIHETKYGVEFRHPIYNVSTVRERRGVLTLNIRFFAAVFFCIRTITSQVLLFQDSVLY